VTNRASPPSAPIRLIPISGKTPHTRDRCHSEEGARVILPSRRSRSADRRIWFGNGAACRARFLAQKVVTDTVGRPSTRFFGRRTGSSGTRMVRRGASLRMTLFFRIRYKSFHTHIPGEGVVILRERTRRAVSYTTACARPKDLLSATSGPASEFRSSPSVVPARSFGRRQSACATEVSTRRLPQDDSFPCEVWQHPLI
jgi:hypothetical protein